MVNTKGVRTASSQLCRCEACSFSLGKETVESRLKKKEKIKRVTDIVNPYYSQEKDRVNKSSPVYPS